MTPQEKVTVGRYRKKSIEVEAVQWTGENGAEVAEFLGYPSDDWRDNGGVLTVSDFIVVVRGDFVVRLHGGNKCLSAHRFKATYEPVDQDGGEEQVGAGGEDLAELRDALGDAIEDAYCDPVRPPMEGENPEIARAFSRAAVISNPDRMRHLIAITKAAWRVVSERVDAASTQQAVPSSPGSKGGIEHAARELVEVYRREYEEEDEQGAGTQAALGRLAAATDACGAVEVTDAMVERACHAAFLPPVSDDRKADMRCALEAALCAPTSESKGASK